MLLLINQALAFLRNSYFKFDKFVSFARHSIIDFYPENLELY